MYVVPLSPRSARPPTHQPSSAPHTIDIPETTLVRAQRRVELDTVTPVHSDRPVIALPGNAELNDALGDLDDGERLAVLGVLLEERLEGRGDLVHGLSISVVQVIYSQWYPVVQGRWGR